jgi:hypothetical protein
MSLTIEAIDRTYRVGDVGEVHVEAPVLGRRNSACGLLKRPSKRTRGCWRASSSASWLRSGFSHASGRCARCSRE